MVIVEINSDNGFTGINNLLAIHNSQNIILERLKKILINKKIDVEYLNELY